MAAGDTTVGSRPTCEDGNAQGIITGPDGMGRRIAPFFADLGRPKAPGPINAAIGDPDAVAAAKALADLLQEPPPIWR
jgi:hypothetical protein